MDLDNSSSNIMKNDDSFDPDSQSGINFYQGNYEYDNAIKAIFKKKEEDNPMISEDESNDLIYYVKKIPAIQNIPPAIITDTKNTIIFSPKVVNEEIKEKKSDEKDSFPFKNGAGIGYTLNKFGLKVNLKSKKAFYNERKFVTKKVIPKKKRIKSEKRRRKFKPDNIRKKIKARFHKDLKIVINDKLKIADSTKFFELLPQSFITNITIELNTRVLSTTFEKLVKQDCFEDSGGTKKNPDRDKYNKNLEVMKYLSENKEINEKAEFNRIKNMKYEELLNAYFSSKEFENSLKELYNKNNEEKNNYFEDYVNKALTYVDFFKNPPKKNWRKKSKTKKNQDDEDSSYE